MRPLTPAERSRVEEINEYTSKFMNDVDVVNRRNLRININGSLVPYRVETVLGRIGLLVVFPEIANKYVCDSDPFLDWFYSSGSSLVKQRFEGGYHQPPDAWPYEARLLLANHVLDRFTETSLDNRVTTINVDLIDCDLPVLIVRLMELIEQCLTMVPEFNNLPSEWLYGYSNTPAPYFHHKKLLQETEEYFRIKGLNQTLPAPTLNLATSWVREARGVSQSENFGCLEPIPKSLFANDLLEVIKVYGDGYAIGMCSPPIDALIFLMIQLIEDGEARGSQARKTFLIEANDSLRLARKMVVQDLDINEKDSAPNTYNFRSISGEYVDNASERSWQKFDSSRNYRNRN